MKMIEREITIVNKLGLHARAAAKLVKLTSTFRSKIELLKDGVTVDAKSILGVLTLAATNGTTLKLRIQGSDEEEAIKAVIKLFVSRFEETH
jgi:phosphocarrier protein